jgi:Protein of unknown function (DUF4231)
VATGAPSTSRWLTEAKAPDGSSVPASVIAEWTWYVDAGNRARILHIMLEAASLVVIAAIPVCAAFDVDSRWIAVLGAVAIVLTGGRQLGGWKEGWADGRKTSYAIQREIALFTVGAGPYGGEQPAARLVEVVEEICAAEREDWHTRRLAYDPAAVVKARNQT